MKMKKVGLIIVCLSVIIQNNSSAQDSLYNSRNNIYLEFLGNGGLGSINYEQRVEKVTFIRIGFSLMPRSSCSGFDFSKSTFLLLLAGSHVIPFYKNSCLEAGICTVVPVLEKYNKIEPFWSLNVGYRLQPLESGFVFRLISSFMYGDSRIYFWPGLSLGYSF
jgi:hypothetical protein